MVGIDWIKFYSVHDLAAGNQLERIPQILDDGIGRLDLLNINQIIELYNIKEYIDSGLLMIQWDQVQIENYKAICHHDIPKLIGVFFAQINNENIQSIHHSIENGYHDDFWVLFEKNKLYERIANDAIALLLRDSNVQLWEILKHKSIVTAYGSILANHLSNNPYDADLIIQEYLKKRDDQKKLYFPNELSPKDKVKLIEQYIELPDANANYLSLIAQAKSTSELPIDDRLKLKAKHIYDKWIRDHIDLSKGLQYSSSVRFEDTDEAVNYTINDLEIEFVYGTKWIKENMEPPTLLNNLIYLFWLVDHHFRCVLVSLPNQMGVIERLIGIRGKNEYVIGSAFHQLDMTSSIQIIGYQRFLKTQGVHLEALFKWFFEQYLKDEFGALGFSYDPPSESSTSLEKCRALATAMDSVLKQFRLYCQEGAIDRELFEMSSEHVFFERVPSMLSCKYIYAKSKEIHAEMNMCYSDQSMMTYTKKTESKYDSLPHMLLEENMSIDDFEYYQKPNITFLTQRGLIINDDFAHLRINTNRAFILKELFYHTVICYSYCSPSVRKVIDQLVESGDLVVENTLFSKPEQDYYNYMLNRASFSNGLDLRNRYIHGTNSKDERIIEDDYAKLLKLSAIMVIKINEEFCLRYPLKQKEIISKNIALPHAFSV